MKILKSVSVIVLIFILLAAAAACGSSGSTSPSPSASVQPSAASPSESGISVIMKNRAFSPAEITIKKGETVTWTNGESSIHNVVSDTFKSDTMNKGDTFSFTFNEVGTFDYVCTFHPGMNGKVIVE